MFRRSFSLFSAFAAVFCLALALPAFGYTHYPVRVAVPFAFALDGKPMPAGEYTFETPFGGNTVLISGPGKQRYIVNTIPVGDPVNPKTPHILFEKTSTGLRLAEIHLQYAATGKRITPTKEEALYAKQNKPVDRVVLALVRK